MTDYKWKDIFPDCHKNDNRYKKHYVNCGTVLKEILLRAYVDFQDLKRGR